VSDEPVVAPGAMARHQRLLALAAGVVCLAAGAVGVFVSDNDTGTAALVAVGALLGALGLLGERPRSLGFGGATIELGALAAELDRAADAEPDPTRREQLRAGADALRNVASPIASAYEALRRVAPRSGSRTVALEGLMAVARDAGRHGRYRRDEVAELFERGGDGDRVFALGIMQAAADLAVPAAILAAVVDSRSSFEHYQALAAARAAAARLDTGDADALRSALEGLLAPGGGLRPDSDRGRLAAEVLTTLRDR
jgi:hypothetical protein